MVEKNPKIKSISIFYILLGIILILEFLYSFIFIINNAGYLPSTPYSKGLTYNIIHIFLSFGTLILSGLLFFFFGLNILERNKKSKIATIIFIVVILGFFFFYFLGTAVEGFSAVIFMVPIIYVLALIGLIFLLLSINNLKGLVCLIIVVIASVAITMVSARLFDSLGGCSLQIISADRDTCFEKLALYTRTLEPCNKITLGNTKDYCYFNLTMPEYFPANNNISKEQICNYIVSDITKEKCLKFIKN